MVTTLSLASVPLEVLQGPLCQFLDGPSLARLGAVNSALRNELRNSDHWKALVKLEFGFGPTRASKRGRMPMLMAPPSRLRTAATGVCWRDVFAVAWHDNKALRSIEDDDSIIQLYRTHPSVLLSGPETHIRNEIILIQGLRRFPASVPLIGLYAQMIRQLGASL